MSYQTGSATSPVDLLQKLATWVATIGWTVDSSVIDGSGWRLHVHKGTVYANFRAAVNEGVAAFFDNSAYGVGSGISLYLGDGYSSGSNWKTQSGGPKPNGQTYTIGAGSPMAVGSIIAYHFFGDATGDNVVVVTERTANIFGHFGWGTSLSKMGTYTGGPYFYGTQSAYSMTYNYAYASPGRALSSACPFSYLSETIGFIRVDVDAFTGKWVGINNDEPTYYLGYTGKNGSSNVSGGYFLTAVPAYYQHAQRLTNQLNGQSLLVPVYLTVVRSAGGYSMLGSVPNVFLCNACAKGFTPATVYNWGSEQYLVFPGSAYGDNWPHYGFAVKKV